MESGGDVEIRVLHVEDDPHLAELTAEFLEQEDDRFSVRTATSPAEAHPLLDSSLDCVVSDYTMPDSDGIEFLKTVRANHPDLPFILFTGKGSEEVASEAISAGVTDYLEKGEGTAQYTVLANRITNAVEQYRSKRALKDREKRLSLFFEESPLGVIEWDERFDIVRVNPAAEAILGYAEDELVGCSWEMIVPESDQSTVSEIVTTLLEEGRANRSINQNLTNGGNQIMCEWHNWAVTDDNNEVVAIYSQFQDVTDREVRKQAVADLHAAATKFTECSSPEAVYQQAVTAAEQVLDFDQAAVATEADGLLHVRAMSDELPLDERPTMAVDEGIAGRSYQTGEAFLVSDANTNEYAEPQGERIHAAISVPVGEYGVFQVIDDEADAFDQHDLELAKLLVQHIETALRRLENERDLETITNRVKFALDATDTVIWATDVNTGETTMLLGPVQRLFQIEDETISNPAEYFDHGVHPDDRADALAVYERVLAGETDEFSLIFRSHPDKGPIRWIESLGYVQTTDDGPLLVGISTDVTEREQRERTLERQNERLEEFARVVSHDLQSPLNVAAGHLAIAREEYNSEHLEELAWALDRMETLIDDLLTLAREGETVCDASPIDLEALLENCWRNVATSEATLMTNVDQWVQADRPRLQQLLENLIRNAVEHGGQSVTITIGELDDGFYVEDDGSGIPEAKRDDVFAAGYSTSEDGTGFGLSIVKQAAEAQGWDVNVTEGSEGGARFEFTGVEFDPG